MFRVLLPLAALLLTVHSQPTSPPPSPASGGGSDNTGSATSTACPSVSGACATDGSSNYHKLALSYSTSTGKFSGSILTNLCMNRAYGKINGTFALGSSGLHSATCTNQTIPAPAYSSTPVAAPLRGRVGLSISGGINIYGPMDDGFTQGQVCSAGSCSNGTDLEVCEKKMLYECPTTLTWSLLPDDCGGHANPYHYHSKLACDWNSSITPTAHSALLGVALDGRGIYGYYESSSGAPTDLDACNGHYGDVPAYNDSNGNSYAAATNVYHYHLSSNAPFTLGCFGPVTSLSACQNLYSTCNTGFSCVQTTLGRINFDLDCPCYQMNGTTYNRNFSSTCNITSAVTPTSSPTKAAVHSVAQMGIMLLVSLGLLLLI